MNKLLIFTLLIFIYSCSSPSPQTNNGDKLADTTSLKKTDTVIITGKFKGLLQTNFSLVSCDNIGEKYPIHDKTGQLDSVFAVIDHNRGIYPPVIEVHGQLKKIKGDDYDGILTVDSILSAEGKNYKNTCIPYDFWCMGNEPFWQLQISEKENLIDLYLPMEQLMIHFEYVKAVEKQKEIIYTSINKKDKIEIRIKNEPCSDGMSERKFNYSALIKVNDRTLKGCAVKFGETITE